MKLRVKIIASLLIATALPSVIVYWLSSPSLAESGALPAELLPAILIVMTAAMGALGLALSRIVLPPLSRLAKAAEHVTKGNFAAAKFYRGKNGAGADELSQVAMAFEIMRKRVVELQDKDKMIRTKTLDLKHVNDELVEKDKVLQRAYARLAGQRQDLEKVNEELSLANQQFAEANAKLQQLDKMKTDFILIAAHELRTPIQPIIGMVQLAEKGLISHEEAWKTIASEAKRLASVATEILDTSKIETGIFSYDMKPLGLTELAESIASASSKLTTQDGGVIAINLDLDKEEVKILGDKKRLVQAFANIIGNAVRFAKNGTITIQTRNSRAEGLAQIRIIDEGPGIPEEIFQLLFNKFVTKTPENERGMGLALFITKNIIEAHSGTISAENNGENDGATFTVSLPIHIQQHPPMAAESE